MRATLLGRHKGKLLIVLAVLAIALLFSAWPAAAAPDTTYYIGFTSDVHNNTTSLQNWLNSLQSTASTTGTNTLHHMVFGGDYEGWATAATCRTTVTNTFTSTSADKVFLVRGNHDGDSTSKATGLVYGGNGEPYAIYALDNTSTSQANGDFKEADITALDTTLAGLPSDIPVFIVAHHPVHTRPGRSSTRAAEFATMVNKYPNAIVLWGHNHTVGDEWYGQVKFVGTALPGITTPNSIGFTYANLGAMNQGNNGANGMLATVTTSADKTTVKFVYSNTSGAVADGSPYVLEIPKSNPSTGQVELDGQVHTYSLTVGTGTAAKIFTTGTFKTGSGTNRLSLVGISWQSGGDPGRTIESVIFTPTNPSGSAVTLTEVKTETVGRSGSGATYPKGGAAIYRLPASVLANQEGTVTVTFAGDNFSTNSGFISIGMANFKGVDQTNPLGTPNASSNNTGTTAISTSVNSAAGGMVFDVVESSNQQSATAPTLTAASGQTKQWDPTGKASRGAASTKATTTAGSTTMSWTAGTNFIWAHVAVPLNPAAGTPVTYTIDASTGANGSISPSGAVVVNQGADQTFTITPATGYQVDEVLVDSAPVGLTDGKYTFTNVQANHTIAATFKAKTYTITATAGANGSISPSGAVTVNQGADQTFTITPASGYEVDQVLVDSAPVSLTDGKYTFTNVQANHTIVATFKEYTGTGQVELDGQVYTQSSATATSDFTTTGTFKTGSGSDRLSLVGISWQSGGTSAATVSSVTFAPTGGSAVNLIEVKSQTEAVSGGEGPTYPKGGAAIYRLPNTIGANQTGTIKVTFSTALSGNSGAVVVGMANFKGVHQTTPLGTPNSSSNKSGATAISTSVDSAAGGMVFDVVMAANETVSSNPAPPSLTPATDQAQQWSDAPAGTASYKRATRGAASTKATTTAGSVATNWTAGTNLVWAHVAAPLNPTDGTPPVTYTVTYNGNGATSGSVPTDSQTYLTGATVTALGNTGNLERTGYSFGGWNTQADGNGTNYAAGNTFLMGTQNVTLYAKWEVNTYTITYTAGPGGTIDGQRVQVQTVAHDGSGTAVEAKPNTGYHFVKWSDGSTANLRTDTNVQADLNVTAWFALDPKSLLAWGVDDGGNDDYGQVRDAPTGNDFVAIAAGWLHNLALKSDGSLVAWGCNDNGQVSHAPTGNDFVAIAAGYRHGLALKSDGSLVAWGYDYYGQATPPPGNDFIAIAAGSYHCLALKTDGSLVAWGVDGGKDYDEGQVSNTPTGNDFVAIAAGGYHNLALKSDGSMVAWGWDAWGQVSNTPTGNDFVAIAAGPRHSSALGSDGKVRAWGQDDGEEWDFGQVSDAPTDAGFVAIAAGLYHGLALKTDGSLRAWGRNLEHQCDVPEGTGFVAISGGGHHSLALAIPPHTVTATVVGTGGTVDPPGEVLVNHGASKIFTIGPDEGYVVEDVLVGTTSVLDDLVPEGDGSFSYTLENVIEAQSIEVSFTALPTYTVAYDGNGATGGSVPTDSGNYLEGATVTVLDNTGDLVRTGHSFVGWNTQADGSGTTYAADDTFTMGTANVTLYAEWTANTYTITVDAGANGSITPVGPSVFVDHGDNLTFTITADSGYQVEDVKVDGTSVGAVTSYEFKNVTDNHTVAATFEMSNRPPEVGTVAITPDPAYPGTQDFTATPADFTDPDGDTLTYTYAWTVNGEEQVGETGATINLTVKNGDVVAVSVTASDGIASSDAATDQVTVGLFPVTYRAGWNLVAGGPNSNFAGLTLYHYNNADGIYNPLTEDGMQHAFGYWLWLEEALTAYLNVTNPPLTYQLGAGWNLIGNSTAVPLNLPEGKYCYVYNGSIYNSTDQLQPGEGAWFWSDEAGSIQLTAAGS